MTTLRVSELAPLIASWSVLGVLTTTLLAAVSVVLHRVLRDAVPQRVVWGTALVTATALSATLPWRRADARAPVTLPAPVAANDLAPTAAPPSLTARARAAVGTAWDGLANVSASAAAAAATTVRAAPAAGQWAVVLTWPLASLLLVGVGAWSYRRQRHALRLAGTATVSGRTVHVTPDVGPAVFGVLRPYIVVPQWLLTRSPEEQRMVVRHEQAHIDARDPLLLLGSCALVALMPWNPAAWYLLSRVRLAIECDCDARVLEGGATPRDYGALLIDLSAAARPLPPLTGAPAFSHRASHLERRLRRMTDRPTTYRVPRRLAGAAIATLAFAAACGAELPTSAELEGLDVAAAEKRAFVAVPDMTAASYVVDGKPATEQEAKAIGANRIASIEIQKQGKNRSVVRITTQQPGATVAARTDSAAPLYKKGTLVAVRANGTADSSRTLVIGDSIRYTPSKRFEGLIFVDGVKASEDAMKMSPDRIASVEVIKGAAAEKIYGPEGANGVIRITTKK